MRTLQDLMLMPWTIRGPVERVDAHGQRWWEIRVLELPGFFVAAETEDESVMEYRPALSAYLASFVDREEEPPVPTPAKAAWQFRLVNPKSKKRFGPQAVFFSVPTFATAAPGTANLQLKT